MDFIAVKKAVKFYVHSWTSFVRYECIYLNRMFKSVDEPNCCEQALKMLIKFDVTLKKPK